MASKRRVFSDEFRATVVERLKKEPISALRKELDLHDSVMRRWSKEAGAVRQLEKKSYSDDFKRQAIARVKGGERIFVVAKELGITGGMLSNWIHGKQGAPKKKTNYYVKVSDRKERKANGAAGEESAADDLNMKRRVHACVGLLRGIRAKANNEDPVHLTALLVLATLEGKM